MLLLLVVVVCGGGQERALVDSWLGAYALPAPWDWRLGPDTNEPPAGGGRGAGAGWRARALVLEAVAAASMAAFTTRESRFAPPSLPPCLFYVLAPRSAVVRCTSIGTPL